MCSMEEDQHHLNLQQQHQYNEGVMVPEFGPASTPCYHPTNSMQPAEIRYVVRTPNSAAHHFDLLMMAHQQQNYQQQLMQESADHHHHHQLHEMMMHNNNNTNTGSSTSGGFATGNTTEANVCDSGGGRWPRQETLTLLELRSRLDHKFKEANQKGPLWDEISRILYNEHGYQRSGKKCREKFENLYKYYKKTKEGKAGRQDGKHYRFFRQLEALYGETKTSDAPLLPLQDATHFTGQVCFDHLKNATSCSNPTNTLQLGSNVNDTGHRNFDSLSFSCSSSDFNTTSSEDNGDLNGTDVCENGYSENQWIKKRRGRRNWKAKIKEFIDSQMRSLIEIQEVWMGKIMKTMEQTEQERLSREEEWKKREEERMDQERKLWANERQWIEARDANLIEALCKFKGGAEILDAFNSNHVMPRDHIEINHNSHWEESEITKLVQLRATMEPKFEQISGGCNSDKEFILWEEIPAKMASLGSNKSSLMCKNKWDSINNNRVSRPIKIDIACKKQKGDNSKSSSDCYNNGAGNISQVEGFPVFGRISFDQTHNYTNMSASNLNASNNNNNVQHQDQSFFRFLVDHEGGNVNLWGNNNL